MDMVGCTLKAKQIPKVFWAEAVATAVYILNRFPTKSVKEKTPGGAWNGRRPSIWHVKVFRCITYAHVPDQLKKNLYDKGKRCIFVGNSSNSKAYKLYNPETQKVIISRDMTFDEGGMCDWSSKSQKDPIVTSNDYEVENEHDPAPNEPETPNKQQRSCRLPSRLQDCVLGNDNDTSDEEIINFAFFADYEPLNFKEALSDKNWRKAMNEEITAIEKNQTRELTELPTNKKLIRVKWVCKIKYKPISEIGLFKARLVAKGYNQKPSIDYFEVFSHVARLDTIRILISISPQNSWKIHQMDVNYAFINGNLEEEVYIEKPAEYVVKGKEDKFYRLKKELYGLKQAPRAWYKKIDSYFVHNGFQRCPYKHTLYIKYIDPGDVLIVCLYVNDLIFTRTNSEMIVKSREAMIRHFEMTDLGLMSCFLIEVI